MSIRPGQQGQVTDVDDDGVVGDPGRRHLEDPVAVDEQAARCHQFARVHVEHAGAAQVDALRASESGPSCAPLAAAKAMGISPDDIRRC